MLTPLDLQELLSGAEVSAVASPATVDDDELLAELKEAAGPGSITELRHVRKSADKRAAEEIANCAFAGTSTPSSHYSRKCKETSSLVFARRFPCITWTKASSLKSK